MMSACHNLHDAWHSHTVHTESYWRHPSVDLCPRQLQQQIGHITTTPNNPCCSALGLHRPRVMTRTSHNINSYDLGLTRLLLETPDINFSCTPYTHPLGTVTQYILPQGAMGDHNPIIILCYMPFSIQKDYSMSFICDHVLRVMYREGSFLGIERIRPDCIFFLFSCETNLVTLNTCKILFGSGIARLLKLGVLFIEPCSRYQEVPD